MDEYRTGCANCGREVHHIVDERGERWVHTVEPTGHETILSREVYVGRARMIAELRSQLERARDTGEEIDWPLVERWLDWFARPDAISTREQDNAAFREAMVLR